MIRIIRILNLGLLATVCSLVLSPGLAVAQGKCPEGRTVSGECVNPALAEALRQTTIIFSQPKISETAFPVLPFDDRLFRYPNQVIPDQLKPTPSGPPPF
jgi:hypothetical protein